LRFREVREVGVEVRIRVTRYCGKPSSYASYLYPCLPPKICKPQKVHSRNKAA
jgi:hypothetical protein